MIVFRPILKAASAAMSAVVLCLSAVSCSLMETDRSECPVGLYVGFVYDYNIERADMFKDHVGYVTLYVFDESDHLVMRRSAGNYGKYRPLASYGYKMHILPEELPDGTYHMIAYAMQRDWDEALAEQGAKYRRTNMGSRGNMNELGVVLDREKKNADGYYPVSNVAPLDTLWHGTMLDATEIKVRSDSASYATISLVRDTKTLNVTLRELDKPSNPAAEKYALSIIAPNGRLDADNNVLPDDTLLYTPYAAWTTRFPDDAGDDDPDLQTTAHYDINFNRLMYDGHENGFAMMRLVNIEDGKLIGQFNLAKLLAEGRTYYESYKYPIQEYLDREHDYRVDFVLKGGTWNYISISVGVLSWSKRIYNTELE